MKSSVNVDAAALFADREADRYALHTRYLNEQMVRVLRTIGYDVGFVRGQAQYLYDRGGTQYLDLLSGFGVFAMGRNHPTIRAALASVLDAELPNLVQMDVSTLAGILAERLLAYMPGMEKVFFANTTPVTYAAQPPSADGCASCTRCSMAFRCAARSFIFGSRCL